MTEDERKELNGFAADDEVLVRMMQLSGKGYLCAQVIVTICAEMGGIASPELVRAAGGLCRGLGACGLTCGALTGGCCALGLYLSKGGDDDDWDNRYESVISEYVNWFEEEIGSTVCLEILDGNWDNRKAICPNVTRRSVLKLLELIDEYELA